MKKKLSKSVVEKIRKRRAAGLRIEDLVREFGLSAGSISNAIKGAGMQPSAAPTVAPSAALESAAPVAAPTLSFEDLQVFVAGQLRGLQSDAERLRNSGDHAAAAAANRSILTASKILASLTPPPSDTENEGVFVSRKDLENSKAEVLEKFARLVRASLNDLRDGVAKRSDASKMEKLVHGSVAALSSINCPACHRPMFEKGDSR